MGSEWHQEPRTRVFLTLHRLGSEQICRSRQGIVFPGIGNASSRPGVIAQQGGITQAGADQKEQEPSEWVQEAYRKHSGARLFGQ